ncbi:hypothetical protein NIES2109_36820 [Nostoc sp. HK-01]|uniref:DUF3040 domain-containing protein n=1 Tax=Anabaenopsis circularis NIES-21 TaxID=1085406 RepID=A0A1Z4GBS6_9CYAN|nr:hypothetical protein NIES21_07460 [Anabaenopsis circularis NIES-21]BBD60882.1 hypothetical protein NIES2109_36820 [Nostoc sp. HK-01]
MKSEEDRRQELEQRERILREREVELRLREIETDIHGSQAPFHQTVKHQPEDSHKPWVKKAILAGKLFALGVAVLVAAKIASAVAGVIIIAGLVWMSYKLFFESPKQNP